MAIFEIQGPDGKTYEVDAPTIEQAAAAMQSFQFPQGGSTTDSAAVAEFGDKGRAMATGMANGASFGFADNLAAVPGGIASMMRGQGFKSGYDFDLGIAREGMGRDAAANPMAYGAGNVAGAAVPAIVAAPLASAGSALGTAGLGAGIGAFEGGLQAAGNADGQDVMGSAVRGAVIGGAAGAAAPAVVGAAGALKNAVKDPVTGVIDGMFGIANTGKANRAIGGALQSSGKTSDDIAAMIARAGQQGQPEFRMMDALGTAGQRQASGIARQGGEAATEIADFLARRQADQGDRIGGFVGDAFGFRGAPSGNTLPIDPANPIPRTSADVLSGPQRSAAQTKGALAGARGDAAGIEYPAAKAGADPVDVRGVVAKIDERLGATRGQEFARDGIDGTFAKYRDRLIRDTPDGTVELSDFSRVLNLKQDLQTEMKGLVGTPAYGELKKIEKAIDEALEASSGGYRRANDNYRARSQVIDAVDTGADMTSTRSRAVDNVPAFQSMSPDMQGAARVGYGDNLLSKLESVTAPTANRAKALQSTKRATEADAMALDPQTYAERLGRENTMWETQNRALGGSRTADNLADRESMEGLAGGMIGAARNSNGVVDLAVKIGDALKPFAKGQNEATRKLIAKALMSDDPVAALAPVLRQETANGLTRRRIEALIRQPMREGGESALR